MGGPGRRGDGRVLLAGESVLGHTALRVALAWTREVSRVDHARDLAETLERASAADLVVADVELLRRDGLDEAVRALRATAASPEVVVAARDTDPEDLRVALMAGARSFLVLGADVGRARAAISEALAGRSVPAAQRLRRLLDRHDVMLGATRARERCFVERLAAAVEAKDAGTAAHLRNVTELALTLAAHVEPALSHDEDFVVGCLLHDVGKIAVPAQILLKRGRLSAEEWQVMRRHPALGAQLVGPIGRSPTLLDVVRHHHERWDGHGYPDGLAGEAIPLAARVFSVCDALEAMTAARPYRAALPLEVALERVQAAAGAQFDPAVVDALDRGLRDGEIQLDRALELDAAAA
jgi:putative nucleotidyltransferase with HDIG domain